MKGNNIGGYTVLAPLGQGTFGQTWLVEKSGQKYALKIFKNEMIRSHSDVKRIDREIHALKEVDHPNIVKYVADGSFKEGYDAYRYLVMEYAEGEPLRSFIERNGRLTVSQTQRIGHQILEGIRAIHEKGLLHRDLKPDNIFITKLGDVRILDFGLVKLLDASTLTATGVPMGTFAYMPPEQLTDSKNVDFRADLYSFGAILFHMITGRIPLEIYNIIDIHKINTEIPPFASSLNPAVPTKLDNIISTLLEKEVHIRKYDTSTLSLELSNLEDRRINIPSTDLTLRYIPRLLHNEKAVVETAINNGDLEGVVYPANFFPKYKAAFNYVRDLGGFTVIDPVVYRLAYSKFSTTQSLVKLPYVLHELSKERPEDFTSVRACQDRARAVLEWQLQQNPSVVVAPFHFLNDVQDEWFDVDLKVFGECRRYMNEIMDIRPLYAGVSIQMESVSDELNSMRLVNKITRSQADGYILMFDIDLNTSNISQYYYFARIVNMLGRLGKPILLSRVNDFGLGLMSIGATAISSGIGYIESFAESLLIEESMGYSMKPKYYIPQLMASFGEKTLKEIFEPALGKQLACECQYCQGITEIKQLLDWKVVKGHYLYQKKMQVDLLNEMGVSERLRWFYQKVNDASNLIANLKKANRNIKIDTKHLNSWLEAIARIERENVGRIQFPSISP